MLTWFGFERVVDDRGYAYLPRVQELSASAFLRWSRERLCMSFYPALAPTATRLTFLARPLIVEVSGVRVTDRPLELPELNLGDLRWDVDIP